MQRSRCNRHAARRADYADGQEQSRTETVHLTRAAVVKIHDHVHVHINRGIEHGPSQPSATTYKSEMLRVVAAVYQRHGQRVSEPSSGNCGDNLDRLPDENVKYIV